jgi:hypothetical protein
MATKFTLGFLIADRNTILPILPNPLIARLTLITLPPVFCDFKLN